MAAEDLVLVTGGSGFLGAYCVIEALNHGYRVRTTVRALHRAPAVRTMLQNGGISPQQAAAVEVVAADLRDDRGWQAACAGCAYVLHVASPLPLAVPRDADELVEPAREGTLRVLRAARAAGSVRRVVLTSSSGAICSLSPLSPLPQMQ